MKKIIFINFPEGGHVYPSVNFCRELTKKKVDLLFYTNKKYFKNFSDQRIDLREYPEDCMKYYEKVSTDQSVFNNPPRLLYSFYKFTDMVFPFILEEIDREKPDFILCDHLALWGRVLLKIRNIPHALFFANILTERRPDKEYKKWQKSIILSVLSGIHYIVMSIFLIRNIFKKYGYMIFRPDEIFDGKGSYNIVLTSRYFQPCGELYEDNYKFTGPSIRPRTDFIKTREVIFIARGTLLVDNEFWKICFKALEDMPYQVIISLGGSKQKDFDDKAIPKNFTIVPLLTLDEYQKVLAKSVLYINHGGLNSISDSISFMTPQMIIPVTSHEFYFGSRARQLGCAEILERKKLTVKNLKDNVIKMIRSEKYHENVRVCRQSFLDSMGFENLMEDLNRRFNLFDEN